MTFLRHGLPLLIVVGGLVAFAIEPDRIEAAALIVSAGLSVWLLNWLWRVGIAGEEDREREDRAREEFDRTGKWPDD
jgi:hypothetical protein